MWGQRLIDPVDEIAANDAQLDLTARRQDMHAGYTSRRRRKAGV